MGGRITEASEISNVSIEKGDFVVAAVVPALAPFVDSKVAAYKVDDVYVFLARKRGL
jgi:hypothetical protein